VCSICGRDIDAEQRRAKRVIDAVLSNIDSWILDLTEIEQSARPGEKSRPLHLMRNMAQARLALLHLSEG
jgi:hypothetical protein